MNSKPDPQRRNPASRPLRVAAVLIAATLALGAALRTAEPEAEKTGEPVASAVLRAPEAGPVHFTGQLDRTAVLAGGDGRVHLELVLQAEARELAQARRLPTDLVVVLDRSGSMAGAKIEHARAAIRALIAQLGPQDRFALVTYAQQAEQRIALQLASAKARASWLDSLASIPTGGGTHLSAGLDQGLASVEAAREADRVPRIVLISDGLANRGDISHNGLRARARRAAQGEFALTTVGVGVDFDGALLAALADAGTGNFHYVEHPSGLAQVFAREFETAAETLASGVVVSIQAGEGVRVVDAAGYPLEGGAGQPQSFRPGSLFAGQERRIWLTLEVPAEAGAEHRLGRIDLRYHSDGRSFVHSLTKLPRIATVEQQEHFYSALDAETWERSVVVDRANALRRSVANSLAAGAPARALDDLRAFERGVTARNFAVKSPAVAEVLEDLDALETQLESEARGVPSISAGDQQKLRALGYVQGRPGSQK